jgi:hypothetical protein
MNKSVGMFITNVMAGLAEFMIRFNVDDARFVVDDGGFRFDFSAPFS